MPLIHTNQEIDEYWMREALELAHQARTAGDVPVGAIVVKDDVAVGKGWNQREALADPLAHAEIIAIRNAAATLGRWRLHDCVLYVTLEPCFMCAGASVLARLQRVVFACQDPKAGAGGSLANVLADPRLNHRCIITAGILAEEASLTLRQFFRSRRTAKNNSL